MYLTYTDYQRIVGNPSVNEENFFAVEVYAEVIVDAVTFGIIGRNNLHTTTSFKDTIQKAMALQIEFMASEDYSSGKVVSSRSTTVGGVTETVSYDTTAKGGVYINGMLVSPMVVSILAPIRAMGR